MPDWLTLFVLSCLLGIYLSIKSSANSGISTQEMLNVLLVIFILGIIGGRTFFIIQHHQYFAESPAEIFAMWKGGFTSLGAIIGGCAGALTYLTIQKHSVWIFADICAPPIALGICLTRVGCFLNGCCFGKVSDLPWAVRYPQGSNPYLYHLFSEMIQPSDKLSLLVHPVQLYYSLTGLMLFLIMPAARKYFRIDGKLFLSFALIYSIFHFLLNTFRENTDRIPETGLSMTQWINLIIISVIITLFLLTGKKKQQGKI